MNSPLDGARQLIESILGESAQEIPRRYDRFGASGHLPVDSYQHGLAVSQTLREWDAPLELQAAGLLHSLHWHGWLASEAIAAACGDRVASLCTDYREILTTNPTNRVGGEPALLRRVRLYMAAYQDPLLALLGAADRWEQLTVAQQIDGNRRRRLLDEVERATIPFLDMLGMGTLKAAAEDWVMAHGPAQRDYHRLHERIVQTEALRAQAYTLVHAHLTESFPQVQLVYRSHTPTTLTILYCPKKFIPKPSKV